MPRLSSPLDAAGAADLEALHERYREDPDSVDVSWRTVFQVLDELGAHPAPLGPGIPSEEEIRARGHLAADLDPLGRTPRPGPPEGEDARTARLRRLYQGTLALETAHIDDAALRAWLHGAFESVDLVPPAEARRRACDLRAAAEAFEKLLALR